MKKCCPMFRIPGRRAIRDDCARLFLERKDSLKTLFSTKGMGRISVTTDCWTNLRNQNFICVTAHFIGRNWQLHKKIIAFRQITSHKGEDVAGSVMEVLAEWDIRSVVCCTVDKASANDVAIRHMREHLELWGGNIISGRYLHMRCVAHIINLIVQDGLEEIGISIRRVREACKWIIASPSRTQTFRRAADNMLLTCKHELSLDMPTRWNATYIISSAGTSDGSSAGLQKRQKVTNDQKRRAGRGSLSSIRSDSDDEDDHSEISELSLYLSEGTFKERKSTVGEDGSEMDIVDKFDVLKWWSSYGIAYPILSEMAKDMFGIPISTVASESAFSLGGRIMDEFRTSLHPTMLEALVCASDWLRDGESVVMDEEDVPIEEQEKEYQRGKLIIS
ncbi:Putative AC transposase [Linum perenne]